VSVDDIHGTPVQTCVSENVGNPTNIIFVYYRGWAHCGIQQYQRDTGVSGEWQYRKKLVK
jgi:hypothetical protein